MDMSSKEYLIVSHSQERDWKNSKFPIPVMELLNGSFEKQVITYFNSGLTFKDINRLVVNPLNYPSSSPSQPTVLRELMKIKEISSTQDLSIQGQYFIFGAKRTTTKVGDREIYSSENPAELIGINTYISNSINGYLKDWEYLNPHGLRRSDYICEQFSIPNSKALFGGSLIIIIGIGNLENITTYYPSSQQKLNDKLVSQTSQEKLGEQVGFKQPDLTKTNNRLSIKKNSDIKDSNAPFQSTPISFDRARISLKNPQGHYAKKRGLIKDIPRSIKKVDSQAVALIKKTNINDNKARQETILATSNNKDSIDINDISDKVVKVLAVLGQQTRSRKDLMELFGLSDSKRKSFVNNFINPAMEKGFIERTEIMQSNKQKYRLTELGKITLEKIEQ